MFEVLDELINIIQYLIHFISLQSLYQELAITAEEKQRATAPTTRATRQFKPLPIGRAEGSLEIIKGQLLILQYMRQLVTRKTLEEALLRFRLRLLHLFIGATSDHRRQKVIQQRILLDIQLGQPR